ncbi:hypothetical protein [Allonocardiopsis opalescens]|uniref:Uncharacterized protein n=1 Tax=Allonocardiopsis opalescens TaxID=1144618 RepID=A0A2T0Q7N9_9ACTN|nr:hypothetical protein [Allonocardiopsis opalescens]PRX99811.1 hypothetical protein CLV72_103418 [Allonocardiopsis opalescens]
MSVGTVVSGFALLADAPWWVAVAAGITAVVLVVWPWQSAHRHDLLGRWFSGKRRN